jgi:high-affinity iron transporter
MFVSLLIVFREAMEAGLIVGIILAATEGVARRGLWIAGGIGAGVAGASLVAVCSGWLSNLFQGAGQEVFTAGILGFAVVMLSWHILFMSRHARELTQQMREMGRAVSMGQRSLAALAAVVAVAVLREGSEVVLFLYGVVVGSGTTAAQIGLGGAAGLFCAAVLSYTLYRGLVIIPLSRLFSVTNMLIALLAAGMAGQAAAILSSAEIVPSFGETIWNSSFLVRDDSFVGRSLHALVGYSARPSGIQLAAWGVTLAVLVGASRWISRVPVRRTAAVLVLACGLVGAGHAARADQPGPFLLSFHNHRFVPDHLRVPANVRFKILVTNTDATADEFESTDLNREKLVAPGQTITVFLGPLSPGSYQFYGDFHQDTAQGVLVAQ